MELLFRSTLKRSWMCSGPMGVQAIKKGAVDFLAKPFEDEELLQAVREAIEKDKQGRAEHTEVHEIRGHITEKLCVDSVAELVRMAEKAGIEPPD